MPTENAPPPPDTSDAFAAIFGLLHAQTRHDFSEYKQSTIARRVARRMAILQIETVADYALHLQQNPLEVDALFRDLLIGVTRFFRDPEAYEALQSHTIPALFSDKHPGSTIRVWVPGCSTGEEAYSIAILLQEHIDALRQYFRLQIFATDIDGHAITLARAAVYPASIASHLSPERLERFFVREPGEDSWRVRKSIRDLLVFSEQDVIRDPPFSRIDLISCRNLLIYLSAELQQKLIPLFHYALAPGGFLLLGTSESINDFSDLFSSLDRTTKLYQRRDDAQEQRLAVGKLLAGSTRIGARRPAEKPSGATSFRDLIERALIAHYTQAAVLVRETGEILYLHGRTGMYLELAPGEFNLDILKMARQGLQQALTEALRLAASQRSTVRYPGLRVKTNGDFTTVNLTVLPTDPAPHEASTPPLFLILLEQPSPQAPGQPSPPAPAAKAPAVAPAAGAAAAGDPAVSDIEALRRELHNKEEYLRLALEDLRTSNEELRSSNEEMQSINEELQSANEELDTSREELQSVNEELATVNAELQQKLADLTRANNDLNNLLAGTGIGTIFVDHQLRIQRFTPAITQVISLIQGDIGRPVGQIVSNLVGYDRLVEDTQNVLDTLTPKELAVESRSGARYLLHIRPYRTLENIIEGAVISFFDVSKRKGFAG